MIKLYLIGRQNFTVIIESCLSIEGHVSTELGAKGIQKLFDNAKPTPINIKVKYIKQQ